jgi:hypothetical protein
MDANEYAQKVTPAAKSLGMLLNKAEWLGKGQRPTVGVSEEQTAEAAKEKTTESMEANTEEEKNLPVVAEAPRSSAAATGETPLEIENGTIWVTRGDRRYRVLGMEKNTSMGALRVNVLVSREEKFHVDTLDLYSARQRVAFAKQAAEELGIKEEVVALGYICEHFLREATLFLQGFDPPKSL